MKKLLSITLMVSLLLSLVGIGALAEESLSPIAGKTLKVAMSPDFMFFETTTPQTPKSFFAENKDKYADIIGDDDLIGIKGYEGLDIDIIYYLTKTLGFDVTIEPMKFAGLIGSLQAGSADFVISGLSYSEERALVVDFSKVYVETQVGCVVPIDSTLNSYEDLKGQVVACSQGTTYEKIINDIEGATLKTFEGQAALGLAVLQGMEGVVAGMTSSNGCKKLVATNLIDEKEALKYFVVEGAQADSYNIAFPKGSDLTEVFDKALSQMIESGLLEEMVQYWLY